jgi:hypothetical protein
MTHEIPLTAISCVKDDTLMLWLVDPYVQSLLGLTIILANF